MTLTELISGRFCPITGKELVTTAVKNQSKESKQNKRDYNKQYRIDNKEKISQRRKKNNHANVI